MMAAILGFGSVPTIAFADDAQASDTKTAEATKVEDASKTEEAPKAEDASKTAEAPKAEEAPAIPSMWKCITDKDPYKSTAELIDETTKSSEWAVIACAENYADAITAAGLAGTYKCPVILTSSAKLNDNAKSELKKLGVKNAYLIGGTSAISEATEKDVTGMDIKCTRIAGATRQETSILAMQAARKAGSPTDTLIIASGHNFTDALSISPWAYKTGSPILLTDEKGMLSDAEVAAIKADGKLKRALVIGNEAAVSDNVASQITGIGGTRIGGGDAYETSAKVADWSVTNGGLTWESPVITSASDYPNGLVGAVLASTKGSVLLMADNHANETLKRLRLTASSVKGGYLVGAEITSKVGDPLGEDQAVKAVRDKILAAPTGTTVQAFGDFTPSDKAIADINAQIKAIQDQGRELGFVMCDLATGKGIAYNANELYYGASSIKAPYFMAVVESNPTVIDTHKDLIQDTLLTSSDESYKEVLAAFGSDPMKVFVSEAGARASIAESLPWASYSARDLALMWGRSYVLFSQSKQADILGSWASSPNVSTIHDALSGAYTTRSKAGWVNAGGDIVPGINHGKPCFEASDDGGIVYAKNGAYVLAIMSNVPGDPNVLDALTLAIDAAHNEIK